MLRYITFLILFSLIFSLGAQNEIRLKGDYTSLDSVAITEAYLKAQRSAFLLSQVMDTILTSSSPESAWLDQPAFIKWLGQPEKIKMVGRKIRRLERKFQKDPTFVVIKKNRGRCRGWISAWTLPYGKVKIRLCEDFLKYRVHLQEKTIVHEMGHEVGMLFHRKIHGCWSADRAAGSSGKSVKRSPENYAWLAVSFVGIECDFRR